MTLSSLLPGLLLFNLLVIAHELGHFFAARRAGLAVPEFGVGFGPRLFSFHIGKTEYVWRLLPLGGYVLLPDLVPQDGAPAPAIRKRLFALLAGPLVNLALAVLLLGPRQTWTISGAWLEAIADMVRGSATNGEVMGLVGTGQLVSEAVSYGWKALVGLAGFLSLNFALFNLLPVPGLDGGRLVGLLLEHLNGGRRPRWEPVVQFTGLLAVLGLGLWVTGHEILRAIGIFR